MIINLITIQSRINKLSKRCCGKNETSWCLEVYGHASITVRLRGVLRMLMDDRSILDLVSNETDVLIGILSLCEFHSLHYWIVSGWFSVKFFRIGNFVM